MPDLKLISFNLCPFVQRSVAVLEEKGVPYDIEYIDLDHKPEWFLKLSPLGKVPVLLVSDEVLFESAVIAEYIDETTSGPRLLPDDALARAKSRAWIEACSDLVRKTHRLYSAGDEEKARKAAVNARSALCRFEEVLGDGPFFSGEAFSLVDAAAAPPLQRLLWCNEAAPSLQLFDDLPKVTAWLDTLLAYPAVQKSAVPELRDLFLESLKNYGDEAKGKPPSWVGTHLN